MRFCEKHYRTTTVREHCGVYLAPITLPGGRGSVMSRVLLKILQEIIQLIQITVTNNHFTFPSGITLNSHG